MVIQEVLRFWRTLTKLSPSSKCDFQSGGCCIFIAGLQVDLVKQALGSVSGTPVKLFFTWLFFCTSNTRDIFFIGISLIFLSETLEVFVGNAVLLAPVLLSNLGRAPLCPCRQLPHRVQSPRNLAHFCWRQVVQLFLSTSALSVQRLGRL